MIDKTQALSLGAIQGVTEYLPVSSSGHLVIAQSLLGMKEPELFFDIVLHIGTLSAVIWYYNKDISLILKELYIATAALVRGDGWQMVSQRYPGFKTAWLIILGTIPTAAIGLFFKEDFEKMFASPKLVGGALLVTAVVLFLTRYTSDRGRTIESFRIGDALVIGLIQGLSITPGLSRSGLTISAALFLGIDRETAARFSFLLSIPSILGALVLQFELGANDTGVTAMVIGLTASAITGALVPDVSGCNSKAWKAVVVFLVLSCGRFVDNFLRRRIKRYDERCDYGRWGVEPGSGPYRAKTSRNNF